MRVNLHLLSGKIFLSALVFSAFFLSTSFSNFVYSQCSGPTPLLVVDAPGPVCSPATISLLSLVNSSSTLPAGTILTYLDGSSNQVSDPSAISQSGTYYIKATTPGGCTDQKPVTLTINQTPAITTAFNFSFCNSDPNLYALNGQNIVSWNGPGIVLQSNTYYFKPSSAGAGAHTLVATGTGGCQASMQVVVTQAADLILNTPLPVCSPTTIDLNQLISPSSILPPGTVLFYYYNGPSGLVSVSDPSAVTESGTYRITANLSGGCGDVAEVQVIINKTPTVTPFTFPFCNSDQNLYALTGDAGNWAGPGVTLQSNGYFFKPSSAGAGTHTLIAISGTSTCNSSMPVVVTQAAHLVLNTPAPICSPATVDLNQLISPSSILPPGTVLFYYYNGPSGLVSVSDPSAVTESGTYRITANLSGGCGDVKEVQVIINKTPTVAPFNFSFCSSDQNLYALTGDAGNWAGPGVTLQPNGYFFKPSSAGAGTYTLIAISGTSTCNTSMPVVVTQTAQLVLNTPAPVCSPATINLTQLISSSSILPTGTILFYYYNGPNGLVPVSDPSAVTESGTYRITANQSGGCGDVKEVQVIINKTPTIIPPILTFCSSDQNLYVLNGQDVGTWNGPGVVYQSPYYYFKPSSAGTGTHTLVAISATSTCSASMQVVVPQSPILVLNTPAPVCSPATINLTQLISASSTIPPGTVFFYYYNGPNGLTSVSDPSSVTQSGTYRITATAPGGVCGDQREVQVTINTTPTITPPIFTFCSNNQNLFLLNGQDVGVWSGPGVVYQSNTYYFKPSSAGAGTHTLVATGVSSGCQASMQVVVPQAPVLVLNTPAPVCSPATINLSTLVNTTASILPTGTVFLYFNNGSLMGSPVVNQSGTYTVRAFAPTGCLDEKSVQVNISQTPTLPNIATTYCSNDQRVSLGTEFVPYYVYPGVPHWSGPGIEFTDVPDGNVPANYNRTYYFNPAVAGAGIHTISKTEQSLNCPASMQITVLIPPSLNNCQTDIAVNNQPGQCGALVNYTAPGIVGTCGNPTLTRTGPASGSVFPIGVTTITFTLKDGSGNTLATCSFKVTVTDTEKPTITAPAAISKPADNGKCFASGVSLGTPISGDNCGVASITNNAPSTFPAGNTIVTWTVTDLNGNIKTATQVVTINDTQKPVVTGATVKNFCNSAGNYSVDPIVASDNCGILTITYAITGATVRNGTGTDASGSFATGTSFINWTVKDVNANVSTWQTKVIVGNAINLTIPDAMALSSGVAPNTVYIGYSPASSIKLKAVASGGTGSFVYNWSNGATTQSITVSPTSTTVYTVTVSDGSGCPKTSSTTVNVVDIRCGNNKVTLCCKSGNNNQTSCIPVSQVPVYLLFGATLGNCSPQTYMTHQQNETIEKQTTQQAKLSMKAYPNPSQASFLIDISGLDTKRKAQLVVYAVDGKVVERKIVTGEKIRIGGAYRAGAYLIELRQGEELVSLQLLKQ